MRIDPFDSPDFTSTFTYMNARAHALIKTLRENVNKFCVKQCYDAEVKE